MKTLAIRLVVVAATLAAISAPAFAKGQAPFLQKKPPQQTEESYSGGY